MTCGKGVRRGRRAGIAAIYALLPLVACRAMAVNVDDFGAIGDGVTWDHAAIQSAINAAGPGGIVEFAAGKTYVQCAQIAPLAGQTLRGNGATLKRCDPPQAHLVADASADAWTLTVDDAGVFALGASITPVTGSGGYADGEFVVNHFVTQKSGNILTITRGLSRAYPAGSLVTMKFDQVYVGNASTNVTVDGLNFDGNRSRFNAYLTWTDNQAVRGAPGLVVKNSSFKDLPGNGIMIYGTNVYVHDNSFLNLDGAIAHLSDTDPIDGSAVTIADNFASGTNLQAARMQHTEGVITISVRNNSVRVIGNNIGEADVPFISPFHDDMRDWLVQRNSVYGTAGAFFALSWRGTSLTDVIFDANAFVNVGVSRTERRNTGPGIENFAFTNNEIIGGSLQLDGLRGGVVTGNTIKTCGVQPVAITNSTDVAFGANVQIEDYCLLRLQLAGAPGLLGAPGGEVRYALEIANAADPLDMPAGAAIEIQAVSKVDSSTLSGLMCVPALPFMLSRGQTARCSFISQVAGEFGDVVSQGVLVRGKVAQTDVVVSVEGNTSVRIGDVTPPSIRLLGESPQRILFGDAYSEAGAVATDDIDGDITASLRIDASAIRSDRPGRYFVVYTVADSEGNAAEITRVVDVVDLVAPAITLLGPDPQHLFIGEPYREFGATATDNADGDISSAVRIDTSAVDFNNPGMYSIRYDASDSSGNAASPVFRAVQVERRPKGGGGAVDLLTFLVLLLTFMRRYRCGRDSGASSCSDKYHHVAQKMNCRVLAVDLSLAGRGLPVRSEARLSPQKRKRSPTLLASSNGNITKPITVSLGIHSAASVLRDR